MSTVENKRAVRRMTEEAWNLGKLEVLDEVCAPNYDLAGVGGIDELKQVIAGFRRSFPDLTFTIEELIAEGDTVVSRWTTRGTHLGEYEGIAPTGKVVTDTGISIFHLVNGKIVDDYFESRYPDWRMQLLEPAAAG